MNKLCVSISIFRSRRRVGTGNSHALPVGFLSSHTSSRQRRPSEQLSPRSAPKLRRVRHVHPRQPRPTPCTMARVHVRLTERTVYLESDLGWPWDRRSRFLYAVPKSRSARHPDDQRPDVLFLFVRSGGFARIQGQPQALFDPRPSI